MRAQLLVVFVLIDIVALIVGSSVAVFSGRARKLALRQQRPWAWPRRSSATPSSSPINKFPQSSSWKNLPVQLRSIRHVRIAVRDASGIPIGATLPTDDVGNIRALAPGWFARLVALPIESDELAVVINGVKVGDVQIVGEPGDEIAEFWDNVVAMAATVALLNVAMVGILYILFGRVLDPLIILAVGLSDLKRQSYDVRMPKPQARELAAITDHFNALARALETARTENLRLNRQLVTAQDDERRRTALELHDEVGPCLFGLKANASSIASVAAELPEKAKLGIAERLRDTIATIDHLQAINRSMLERLRPMALVMCRSRNLSIGWSATAVADIRRLRFPSAPRASDPATAT